MFSRKTLLLNISWCFCERLRVKRARFLRFLNVLLNRAAVGWAVSCSAFGLFIFFLSVTISKPPRMMSSSASYRPFFSSFRHIPPQEHFVKLANYYSDRTRPCVRNVYLIKIGPKSHGHTRRDICVENWTENVTWIFACFLPLTNWTLKSWWKTLERKMKRNAWKLSCILLFWNIVFIRSCPVVYILYNLQG